MCHCGVWTPPRLIQISWLGLPALFKQSAGGGNTFVAVFCLVFHLVGQFLLSLSLFYSCFYFYLDASPECQPSVDFRWYPGFHKHRHFGSIPLRSCNKWICMHPTGSTGLLWVKDHPSLTFSSSLQISYLPFAAASWSGVNFHKSATLTEAPCRTNSSATS